MNRYSLCTKCTVRNCRRTPKELKHGMYKCYKRRAMKDGWPLLEIALDTSPVDTLTLVHAHKGQVTESKKGYRIRWQKGTG
jgi:hypothetical protein